MSGSPFSSVNVHTWHAGQGLPQDLPAGAQKQNASQPLVTSQKCLIQLLCLYTKFKAKDAVDFSNNMYISLYRKELHIIFLLSVLES